MSRKVLYTSRPCAYGEEPFRIFIDDEPLEKILYGQGEHVQTPVNLYHPALQHVHEVADAYEKGTKSGILAASADLTKSDTPISVEMCRVLAYAYSAIFPDAPFPIIDFDYASFGSLLERMWGIATSYGDAGLKTRSGSLLSRWYEYFRRYEESRQVYRHLIDLHRQDGYRQDEAWALNNLGFTYLLEKRWTEAMPFFEEAAKIYLDLDMHFNHANSLCNWWQCRFELGHWGKYARTKGELKVHMRHLKGRSKWHERKPHILLARLAEHRGNVREAIMHVKYAIKCTQDSGTRYAEVDEEYLKILQAQL